MHSEDSEQTKDNSAAKATQAWTGFVLDPNASITAPTGADQSPQADKTCLGWATPISDPCSSMGNSQTEHASSGEIVTDKKPLPSVVLAKETICAESGDSTEPLSEAEPKFVPRHKGALIAAVLILALGIMGIYQLASFSGQPASNKTAPTAARNISTVNAISAAAAVRTEHLDNTAQMKQHMAELQTKLELALKENALADTSKTDLEKRHISARKSSAARAQIRRERLAQDFDEAGQWQWPGEKPDAKHKVNAQRSAAARKPVASASKHTNGIRVRYDASQNVVELAAVRPRRHTGRDQTARDAKQRRRQNATPSLANRCKSRSTNHYCKRYPTASRASVK